MAALHVAQLNFLPAPEDLAPAQVLERWPSLVDIADVVAGSGPRVSVVQAAACEALITRDGVDYHFVDIRGLDTAQTRGRRFADRLAGIEADVLHANGLGFAEDAFAVAQCLPRSPMIFQDHADRPPRWWRRTQWRRWYATAAGVVFTATGLSRPFVRAGLFGPATRVFGIPESSSRFTPGDQARARSESGIHGDPCLLWVGHLSPGKDPLSVLEGVARATRRLPGLQLWCAFGRAPMMDAVQRRIRRDPRLAGRVHLLGQVAHARVETLMRAADLFVSGSLSESCGYAALEAMACGTVPVLTDIPSFRALTDGGRIGMLWPRGQPGWLAAALVRVAAARPSRADVRAHFEAKLSFAAVGRQWADAYAQVLMDARRGPG